MSDPAHSDATLPAIHILHLLEVVKRWNVDPEELLAGLDLRADSLALPDVKLSVATVEEVIDRARTLSGEPAIGLFFGMQMKVSWHGFLGFAAMSASTIGEALALATRFIPTRTSALTLRLDVDDETAALVIEERTPLSKGREPLIFALLVGLRQIGNTLTGRLLEGTVDVAFPRPDYFAACSRVLPGRVRFDRPEHRLVFPVAYLDVPIQMSDPGALELARRQCEAELDALGRESDFVARVRAALADDDTTAAVAKRLGVSTRTLKRRLADAGTTFSDVVAARRRDVATALLRTSATIDEIAAELGYADAQSFSRAFRRWTGMTPSAYRKSVTT
jgi:AraC-like DNA-binding protein